MKQPHVAVIGGGFAGLATAALLGSYGYAVTLFEKNTTLGGRAMVWKTKGFTFDMGPSWYLTPEVFDRYFALFGKKTTDFYSLKRLDPQYRVFFDGQQHIDISADLSKTLSRFTKLDPDCLPGLHKLIKETQTLYTVAFDRFLYKTHTNIFDFFTPEVIAASTRLKLFTSLETYLSSITTNKHLKQILSYTSVFLGSTPDKTPALYALLIYADLVKGVLYPHTGIGSVVAALRRLCDEYMVTIHTDAEVTTTSVAGQKLTTLTVNGKHYPYDIVVATADYHHVETQLLPQSVQTYPQSFWEKQTLAPSAFLIYLGLSKKLTSLSHHNLLFSTDPKTHFETFTKSKKWPENPSVYLSCPSKTDPTVAPLGCENVCILVPVAAKLTDTQAIRQTYETHILKHVEQKLGESLTDAILVKRTIAHTDYSQLYHAYGGTAFGLAHTLFQTAVFRPANKSKKLTNLYYAGQYTHPGIGMPMCLISAELTANTIRHDYPIT